MKPYIPVPVEAAKEISEKYGKAIVIINTWDTEHGLLHTTTFGASPEQKQQAAVGGDISAAALGADLLKKNTYEDLTWNFNKLRKLDLMLARIHGWFHSGEKPNEEVIKDINEARNIITLVEESIEKTEKVIKKI